MERKKLVSEYINITLGIVIIVFGYYFFYLPQNIIAASSAGLAVVLHYFVPLSIAGITLAINVALLLVSVFTLGREFGAKTLYSTVLFPAVLQLLESFAPGDLLTTGDSMVDLMCGLLTTSAGVALIFNQNASSGGTDIIAKLLNKYLHMELGRAMQVTGLVIVASSFFTYGIRTCVLSMLNLYLNGICIDYFINGFNVKREVVIISEHWQEIQEHILHGIDRGSTLYRAVGGYTQQEKHVLVTVLSRNEYGRLKNYVFHLDPNAFFTVKNVSEVGGYWKYHRF